MISYFADPICMKLCNLEESGELALFRYEVKPKAKISCFEPNEPDANPQNNFRGSVIGALAKGHFNKLPRSKMASVLWEVSQRHGVERNTNSHMKENCLHMIGDTLLNSNQTILHTKHGDKNSVAHTKFLR